MSSGQAAFLEGAYRGIVKRELPSSLADEDGGGDGAEDEESSDDDAMLEGQSDLQARVSEKLFVIRHYLQELPGHDWASFQQIADHLAIDLNIHDDVLEKLRSNEKILVDSDNSRLKYQPKLSFSDLPGFLDVLRANPDGVQMSEVIESGPRDIAAQVEQLIICGAVIAIRNRGASNTSSNVVLFPRGDLFLTSVGGNGNFTLEAPRAEGSGLVDPRQRRYKLTSRNDVRDELHRGDAVIIGREGVDAMEDADIQRMLGTCTRVSLETAGSRGDPSDSAILEQISRLPNPYSRSSQLEPFPPKGGMDYKRSFMETKVPVAPGYQGDAGSEKVEVFKHGCTNDIREVWHAACKKYTYRPQDVAMVDAKLISENIAKADWIALGNAGPAVRAKVVKKKRRGGRVAANLTNAHLDLDFR